MGKSKTDKKTNGVKPVASTVKEGRVAKASQTPVVKAKEAVKAAVAKSDKKEKSKKKVKEPTPEPESESSDSDVDSDADSDVDSDSSASSDDKEEAKPAPKLNGKTNGVAKAAASDSDSSDDSSDESDDEAPAAKPKSNGVNGAIKKAAADSSDESADSDSESDSDAETPAAKAAVKVASDSSSDSDDSSADSSESESEVETPAKVNGAAKKAAGSDSSDDSASDSDSGSDSDASDDDEETEAATEAPSKKRKAEVETTPATKKAKPDVNGFNDKRASKNLFVGNIAWGIDEDALAAEFEEFGDIVGCRIMTDRDSGRSKGFGYVEFETVEMAVAAYNAKQGAEIGGRTLNVDYSEPRPQRDNNASYSNDRASKYGDKKSEPSDTVFLGNLSFEANNDMISELFQQFGEITRVSLPTDRESGQLKGFGYVGFSSVDEATAAIAELQGADVGGRPIRLDFAGPRPENNDSPRGGRGGFGGRGGGRGGGGFGGRGGGRGRGGDRGFGGRGGGRGGRGGSFQSTNRGGFGDFKGKKVSFD